MYHYNFYLHHQYFIFRLKYVERPFYSKFHKFYQNHNQCNAMGMSAAFVLSACNYGLFMFACDRIRCRWEIFRHLSIEFVRALNKYPYDSCDRDFPEVIPQILITTKKDGQQQFIQNFIKLQIWRSHQDRLKTVLIG